MYRKVLAVFITLGLLISCGNSSAANKVKKRTTYCPVAYGAHRGVGTPDPNAFDSPLAMQAAIDDPSILYTESDVRITSDNKTLMMHSNAFSEATTRSEGYVSEHTQAAILKYVRMKDGSVPQTLEQWVSMFVTAKRKALLHVKNSALRAQVVALLSASSANKYYIRVMAPTFTDVEYYLDAGLQATYLSDSEATPYVVNRAKADNVNVLVVDDSRNLTPSNWIQPFIDAGLRTDYVTYNDLQDTDSANYNLSRVLSGDITKTKQLTNCQ